ncbi:MAG: HlyD family efflux transporter periplasmic adaptor subunit, partial [Eudoraea sp.]
LNLSNLSIRSLNKDIVNSSVYNSELQLSKQELKGKINQWENQFVIKSPVSGTVTVFDIWNRYQNVSKGEHVITIIPEESTELVGRCKVPIRNSAKIKKGQNVLIKLDNYPYREWGTLSGKVLSISETTKKGKENYYAVYVEIPELITSYDIEIEFKQEMYGSARIVLEETSLLERIFYQFRSLWSDFRN